MEVFYDPTIKPLTSYPGYLAEYLAYRFRIIANAKILDAGCGRGDFLRAFAGAGLDAAGLDFPDKLGTCRQGFTIQQANFETDRFPFPDDTFDVVFSKSVIEHLHKPDNFLREIWRVLKPAGRIIIMTPDWQTQRYIFYNDYTHVQPYIASGLENALKLHDFREVSAELFYQLPAVWRFPFLKLLCRPLQILFPVKRIRKSGWWRWARELMIIGTGVKSK